MKDARVRTGSQEIGGMSIIAVIGVALTILALLIIYRMRTGHLIFVHAVRFRRLYALTLEERGAQKDALREALSVFQTCPRLMNLSENDLERIVAVIGDVPDPQKVIYKIIMNLDSKKALAALQDEELLRRIATAIYENQPKESPEIISDVEMQSGSFKSGVVEEGRPHNKLLGLYLRCAKEAFEVAHNFVALRDEVNNEAGTVASLAKNLFTHRDVDYQNLVERAVGIKDRVQELKNSLSSFSTPQSMQHTEFRQALGQYIDALLEASDIFRQKTEFMARKATGIDLPGMSFSDLREIIKEEWPSLERCQETGDRLTGLYRVVQ